MDSKKQTMYIGWAITILLVVIPQAISYIYAWGRITQRIEVSEIESEKEFLQLRKQIDEVKTSTTQERETLMRNIENLENRINALHPELSKIQGKMDLLISQMGRNNDDRRGGR